MNFKDPKNKEHLISNYEKLWNTFDALTKEMINTPSSYKRSALLYYWLKQYYGYIKGEPTFNPKYRPALKKGDIIKVNFGFNIGNEFGGLHYAVVMNDSSVRNGVATVIPLRSIKKHETPENLPGNDVFLDNELYLLLVGKLEGLQVSITNQMAELKSFIATLSEQQEALEASDINYCNKRLEYLKAQNELIKNTRKEILSLKEGSIAIVNQIRTISKIRIVDPQKNMDILYGIRISREKMQLIKNEVCKLYDI